MILENRNDNVKVEGDDFLTIKSQVNKDKLAKLYGLLSNIYRNPIGSIVREYASNGYDANREAYNFKSMSIEDLRKKYEWTNKPEFKMTNEAINDLKKSLLKAGENEPIIVGIQEVDGQEYFYVKDYGIGLSQERMMYIYFNYLDSTKEDTNDEIGGFGIGSKSALSYTHTFFIDTAYNGIMYNYIMSKDSAGIPEGQLLFSSDYDENIENGTTIRIPIKNNNDTLKYMQEAVSQLSYMDNVYFDNSLYQANSFRLYGADVKFAGELNDYKIYRGKSWIYNISNKVDEQMHLCLGKVKYSIDWTELGIPSINIGLGIPFEIGELNPTPSRESILYTPHSIALIKERIELIKSYFEEKFRGRYEPTEDFAYFLKKRGNSDTMIEIADSGKKFNVYTLLDYQAFQSCRTEVTYKPFDDIGLKSLPTNLFWNYRVDRKISNTTAKISYIKNYTSRYIYSDSYRHSKDEYVLAKDEKVFTFHHNASMLEARKANPDIYYDYRDIFIIEKPNEYDFDEFDSKLTQFNGHNSDQKHEIHMLYHETIENHLKKITINYDSFYPDPNWHHRFLAGNSIYSINKKKRESGIIPVRKYNYHRDNFINDSYDISNLYSRKGVTIYAKYSEKQKIESLAKALGNTERFDNGYPNYNTKFDKAFQIFLVSEINYKKLSKMENTLTVDKTVKELRTFKRILTCYYIKDRFENLNHLSEINENMSNVVSTRYEDVNKYLNDNHSSRYVEPYYVDFMNEALQVALDNKLVDQYIVDKVEYLEKYSEGLDLLKYIKFYENKDDKHYDVTKSIPILVIELLKLKGKEVSKINYLKSDIVDVSDELKKIESDD